MKRLRVSIIIILAYLILLFILSMYTIQVGAFTGALNLGSWLAIAAVITTTIVQTYRKVSPQILIGLWMVIYILAGLLKNFQVLSFVRFDLILVAIFELVLLALAIILANNVTVSFEDLLSAFQLKVSLEPKQIGDSVLAEKHLEREIYRSRRFKHPLSIVLMRPRDGKDVDLAFQKIVEEVQLTLKREHLMMELAKATNSVLRQTDLLFTGIDENYLMLVSPYTDAEAATLLAERIVSEVQMELGFAPTCGFATFPEDSITSDQLVALAQKRLVHNLSTLPADGKH